MVKPSPGVNMMLHYQESAGYPITRSQHGSPSQKISMLFRHQQPACYSITKSQHGVPSPRVNMVFHHQESAWYYKASITACTVGYDDFFHTTTTTTVNTTTTATTTELHILQWTLWMFCLWSVLDHLVYVNQTGTTLQIFGVCVAHMNITFWQRGFNLYNQLSNEGRDEWSNNRRLREFCQCAFHVAFVMGTITQSPAGLISLMVCNLHNIVIIDFTLHLVDSYRTTFDDPVKHLTDQAFDWSLCP